ncbi:2-succinyl-6-hydroxy-2,4-cyclohexadiene-1-carboxylic acid synthase/2-oxoglutarate decarboxylase [Calothrix sp. NIES-4071]|nr:2-succinyl-6-hydroxy-2,4-cyclohexadiene-1-carboxylic acid synthase/2-oxoglutarate decarboxylase [Calothrix sp. NIES-4071]BAZ59934.1 2-succinyl-6-hydroxy-2,4-cyclohexadiene-1-carboxylic acid synthase/2-oxoglutarate decarboxylase [Calothrix sp. NIES-4105]
MSFNFSNTNELWSFVLVETLKRLGLTCAVICPGSRSTPLAVAFALAPDIEVIPILDERSAAFFALGRAKATHKPVAVVCTSGTAGANFYPAVIEAKESCVPLLLLTADRPQELRFCHSGQTIDQVKLYGDYPNWQAELVVPSASISLLTYLRQTVIHAYERCIFPQGSAVHLNIPFRDPLAPIPDGVDLTDLQSKVTNEDFWCHIQPISLPSYSSGLPPISRRGIIIAGVAQPTQSEQYCNSIANLARALNFPVLAEGLSPVRNHAHLNPYIISTYDAILRHPHHRVLLAPEVVILIGEMPTSKELRTWLQYQPRLIIIDKTSRNLDSLHLNTTHLRLDISELTSIPSFPPNAYLEQWRHLEAKTRAVLDRTLEQESEFEGKAAWLLSQILPPKTPLFIANSMPVRDVEFFWKPNNLGIEIFVNRGANGIDGTLSTALGIAHRNQSSVMLTGDLALLHDTNGFLIRNKLIGHLTIILINNNGGGIFEMLPISQFEPPFEELFATPQDIDFAKLCATYNIEHELITSWNLLKEKLNPLPTKGIRVLELRTNRKADAKWRKHNLSQFAN